MMHPSATNNITFLAEAIRIYITFEKCYILPSVKVVRHSNITSTLTLNRKLLAAKEMFCLLK